MSRLTRATRARAIAASHRFLPRGEALEDRALLANLRITDLAIVDADGKPMTSPVLGQQYLLQAQWTSSGLGNGSSYLVRFAVDGIALNSPAITGESATNSWKLGGWYASPGPHTATATIDAVDTVPESSESDNTLSITFNPAPPNIPTRMIWPLGSSHDPNVRITNFNDVDPRLNSANDYAGGNLAYDGHDGFDIDIANFAMMDAGKPVYAAASGKVIAAVDGNFDRNTAMNNAPANYVAVDIGDGWVNYYYHLKTWSIAVKVGDLIVAGQPLGLVGSSGNSTGAHLHFATYHQGLPVETMDAPWSYFVDPPAYTSMVSPYVITSGISNGPISNDYLELPTNVSNFPSDRGWNPWFWYYISNIPDGSSVVVDWYRPNGTLYSAMGYTQSGPGGGFQSWHITGSSTTPGTWQVALIINGVEFARRSFNVTPSGGDPEIRLEQGATTIIDGRSTAIDLPTTTAGGLGVSTIFTIRNTGASTLALGNLSLPSGVQLVGTFPASVAAGGSANFALALNSAVAGTKFGAVQFSTNDRDESDFDFNVRGSVTGSALSNPPSLTMPGPSLVYLVGASPQLIDPGATLNGNTSSTLAITGIRVEFASAGRDEDRLGIRDDGSVAGKIGILGKTITYGGIAIGTYSGGAGTTPLQISLNGLATLASTQAVLRNLTFADAADTSAITIPRYIRVSLIDSAGMASSETIKNVIFDTRSVATLQVSPSSPSLTIGDTVNLTATAVMSDGTKRDLTSQVHWECSNLSVATLAGSAEITGIEPGTVTITASLSNLRSVASLTVPCPDPTSILLTPLASTIACGLRPQFKATGRYDKIKPRDLTAEVVWTSSNPAVASISTGGLLTTFVPGNTTITAMLGGISASTTITVTPAVLASIQITSATRSIALGRTLDFHARGIYTDSAVVDLDTRITWSSSQPTIAPIDSAGIATGLAVGSTTITGTFGSLQGSVTFTIDPAALITITVVADSSVPLPKGLARAYTAFGTYTDGTSRNLTDLVAWVSSDPIVATMDPDGLAWARSVGTTTITAASADIVGGTVLSVNPAALTAVIVTSAGGTVRADDTSQLFATGSYTDGSTMDLTRRVSWKSSNPTNATIDVDGRVQGMIAGWTTISASLDGITSTGLVLRTIQLVSLSIAPADQSVPVGLGVPLTAIGSFDDGSSDNLTNLVTWASGNPGVASIAVDGTAIGLRIGRSAISASLGSIVGSITLDIFQPVLLDLTIQPINDTVPQGATQQLIVTGRLSDGSTLDLTRSVTWSSTSPGVVSVSTTGVLTTIAAGSATIQAASGSVLRTLVLFVRPRPVTIVRTKATIKRSYLSNLTIFFGAPVSPIGRILTGFQLVSAGHDRIFGTKDDRSLKFRSAKLSKSGRSMVLTPGRAVSTRQPLRLTMITDGGPIVSRATRQAIDGNRDGKAGGVYPFVFGLKARSRTP